LLKKNFLNSVYLIFLGSISTLSLPPYNYYIINFVTFTLFFIFIFNNKNISCKNITCFKYGWFFGFGYFLSGLYWISISLTFDQTFKFLIPLAIILVPSFLAVFYGLITYLFSIFYSKNVIISFLIFSILFGTIEVIRGFIFTGFPWNLIAFSFSKNVNFIQILSIIGTYSFNLICISLFTCPAIFILKKSKKEILLCFFFIVVSVSFLIFGTIKNNQFNLIKKNKHDYIIRAISPNISLDRFYSNQDELKIINELISLSDPKDKQPTIFLWPEGIIPDSYLGDMKIYEGLFSKNFSKNHLIIMGLNDLQYQDNKNLYFNSLAVFDSQLNLIKSYNKIKLVPFGEFVPFENFFETIGLRTITNNYQSFSRGLDRKPLNIKNNKFNLSLLPLICYEIIYSGKLYKHQKFDYIINISEDGWFGKSIGPKQHFAHSIFRSIESGKYIVRSANNGISAIINPIGIVEKKVKFGDTGYIDFTESKVVKTTTFAQYGNITFIILILLYIFLIFSFNRIKNE
jgi:apolipoprotein N-acyltransferase|tara:strand:+ start:2786 stop:4330 length:1545 start_codon:yes stop_codon:yes gene_type:complete